MRRTKVVTITDEGRDKGKTFLLEEMPAAQAEEWAARALLAVTNAGIDLPDDMEGAGMAAIAVMGLKALVKVKFDDVRPLMVEMMQCVRYAPDPAHPEVVRALLDDDIEEVATRVQLRAEVFSLHTGFSVPVVGPK